MIAMDDALTSPHSSPKKSRERLNCGQGCRTRQTSVCLNLPAGHEHSVPSVSRPLVEFPQETHELPSEKETSDEAAQEVQVKPA